ncbi:MAG TPA: potassium transporter Kup [Burkholderiales bacterium]|nr:potassium transporter Kup [Burkholderiales bacterium]
MREQTSQRSKPTLPAALANGHSRARPGTAALTLAALGVVFGDIGTSPLYAVREIFAPGHGISLDVPNILGGLSLIFWSLMVVVSLKYVVLIMRADNRGEGGIMALLALAASGVKNQPQWQGPLLVIGVFGAALFYGDAVLTPAISVLSAVEGLEVGTSALKPYVVPIAVVVIVVLFVLQSRGTAAVGMLFGPVTLAWFLALGAAGLYGIVRHPGVLAAVNPLYAFFFISEHVAETFVVLGAVVLAVTGAEALYADMGHFGKGPVRIAWASLVAPALVLNYFGQGALLIASPEAVQNPFYRLVPQWALYPMVLLATAATAIASQATISGAYSITRQAIQLGFLPRMNVVQTSARERGQIYVPVVNWLLAAAVLLAVTGFGSSSRLASAYGVAVTATMLVDTLLAFFVIRFLWKYPLWLCVCATGFFVAIDLAFFSATLLKLADGGWFPLAIGACVFTVMLTWRQGRSILYRRLSSSSVPLAGFLQALFREPPPRVPGTAVFLTATPEATPHALLHNLNHNKVLHERVIFLTVEVSDEPWVSFDRRVQLEKLGHGCWRMRVRYGFMNEPDIVQALEIAGTMGLDIEMMSTSFFLSRETVVPAGASAGEMALWRERLFAMLARNAGNAADYFKLPANRVIELGTKVEI